MPSQYCDPAEVVCPDITDADKLAKIREASAEADGYIAKRYTLPLLAWGSDLRGHVRRMARYNCFSDRGFDPQNPADQALVRDFDRAMTWLEKVAVGDVELVDVVDSKGSPVIDKAAPLHDGAEPRRWQWGVAHNVEDC